MAKLTREQTKSLFSGAKDSAAESGDGGFEQVAPGKYQAKLTNCEFYVSQADKLFIRHFWTILEGEQEGKVAQDYRRVESENGIKYTLIEWKKMGVDIDSVEDYDAMSDMAKIIKADGMICKIRIAQNKNNPDFQNMYIEELIDSEPVSDDSSDEDSKEGKPSPEAKGGAEDSDEDEGEIGVGDVIEFMHNGEKLQKAIILIDEDEGTVTVKVLKKKVILGVDDILDVIE